MLHDVQLEQHFVNVEVELRVLLSLLVPAEMNAESEEVTTKIPNIEYNFLYANMSKKEYRVLHGAKVILLTKATSQRSFAT